MHPLLLSALNQKRKTATVPVAAVVGLIIFLMTAGFASAQDAGAVTDPAATDIQQLSARLDGIASILADKIRQRDELAADIVGADDESMTDERQRLVQINQDIASLRSTFELVALGDIDVALIEDNTVVYDWKQELVEIVAPLLDSLKSLTKKPRQLSELRNSIELNTERLEVANNALNVLDSLQETALEPVGADRVKELEDKWLNEQQTFEQKLLITKTQLDRLESTEQSALSGVWPATRSFLLGRGLTLLMVVFAAVLTWVTMRFMWWVYEHYFTTKTQRRGSLWYRLLSYSFYILTVIVMVLAVLTVLYVREDLLLLAVAVVLIAAAMLGLRQFIPGYIKEARLLLNLGAVKEDESLEYAGLPYQVMSINLETVLRNPALDGIVRLPLEAVSSFISRPVKEGMLWFPTQNQDYIFLPDGGFGQVIQQSPELVQVRVKGGMIQSWPAAEFYAMSIINISRGQSYGVAVTFGFDYSLQSISLTEVPQTLAAAVRKALADAGYGEGVKDLLVDMQSAGSSSIDYLIFVTMDSKLAKDYYAIQRLVNKTCVAVANEHGWNIPFPQMVVHHQPLTGS